MVKYLHFIKHMDKISRSKVLANRVSNFILLGENWGTWWLITYNVSTSQHNFATAGGSKHSHKDLSIWIIGSREIRDNHHKCCGLNEYLFAFVNCCFRKISIAASVTPSNAILWFNDTLTHSSWFDWMENLSSLKGTECTILFQSSINPLW